MECKEVCTSKYAATIFYYKNLENILKYFHQYHIIIRRLLLLFTFNAMSVIRDMYLKFIFLFYSIYTITYGM